MKYNLLLFLVIPVISFAQTPECKISEADWKFYFAMDFQTFDQTLGKGWRALSDNCPIEAAIVIDQYRSHHSKTLDHKQKRILLWHAGQEYAVGGIEKLALIRFRYSSNPDEPAEAHFKWNSYVAASIAFLQKDFERLKLERNKMAKYPKANGVNLTIVNNMVKCPDSPYKFVISGVPLIECMNERLGDNN